MWFQIKYFFKQLSAFAWCCGAFALLTNPTAARAAGLPFLVIDLAGGAALPGNFLVGGPSGPLDLLLSYDSLGWDPYTEAIDQRFGLPMAAESSKILSGIINTASAKAQANLRFASLCHPTVDDSSNNPTSAIGLVNLDRAEDGDFDFPTGLGTQLSISGGISRTVHEDHILAPLWVHDVAQQQEINDPRQLEIMRHLFNISPATASNDPLVIQAAILLELLRHRAPSGVITLSGFDYHNLSREYADTKDYLAGQLIGRVIEAAMRYNTPIFIQIITDGGVVARQGTREWVANSGKRGMTVLGFYDPIGAADFRHLQVGHYLSSQTASPDTAIGADPKRPAYITFSNYMYATGRYCRECEKQTQRASLSLGGNSAALYEIMRGEELLLFK